MSIKIQPVRFTENGFMTRPFALGGEGAEGLDPAVKYRSCLQNWVVDTGSEVILVDTGLPAEYPDAAADPDAQIYLGTKIKTYLEALADLGYKPEQVSKILITHKHADHTGELRAFPNAQIICSAAEAEADEIKPYNPTVATFADGAYYEFPASQRIAPGVTYISAPGHTTGNCIVAVETDGLFYLIHGDVKGFLEFGKAMLVALALMAVLTLLGVLLLAAIYGGKYVVLFEMDEEQIKHIQLPRQVKKAQALSLITALVGIAAKKPVTAGAGLLAAGKTSSTSVYKNVRRVVPRRALHLIKVNQLFEKNQIYVPDEDFDFVYEYIKSRCPMRRDPS